MEKPRYTSWMSVLGVYVPNPYSWLTFDIWDPALFFTHIHWCAPSVELATHKAIQRKRLMGNLSMPATVLWMHAFFFFFLKHWSNFWMWGTLGEKVSSSSLGPVLLLILHRGPKGPDNETLSASTYQSEKWASKVEIHIGPQTHNKNINRTKLKEKH